MCPFGEGREKGRGKDTTNMHEFGVWAVAGLFGLHVARSFRGDKVLDHNHDILFKAIELCKTNMRLRKGS